MPRSAPPRPGHRSDLAVSETVNWSLVPWAVCDAGPGDPVPRVDSGTVRVLVAEDDENLAHVLARGLREQGYVVDVVPDGDTAASYLRFYRYEVVVLDWRMPRLSGLDLVAGSAAVARRRRC